MKNNINFEECFERYYPCSYRTYDMIASISNSSVEDYTLEIVKRFKGGYELEDGLMGAYLIHIAKGNIKGIDLDEVISRNMSNYNFSQEFINYIKRNIK